ncbi:MAG: SBBP repeat-containing protein [bacterium]
MHSRYMDYWYLCFVVLTFFSSFVSLSNASQLVYSTYLGGSNNDYSYSIAVDNGGNTYITGATYSSDFPTTSGVFDTSYSNVDIFVAKLNPNGTGLVYSTYLGGSDVDYSNGIAIDSSGNAYIIGGTLSDNFPATSGAFDVTYNGGTNFGDVIISKLNANGTGLIYSTYLGGGNDDYGAGIAVDSSGYVYVTGYTASVLTFPTTTNAIDRSFNGGADDAFISKLNSNGTGLVYSTFLGGSGYDEAYSIALDNSGNAYITGGTSSSDFPTTSGAFDSSYNGGNIYGDSFVSKLNADGTSLVYSTYLGGSDGDSGVDIAVDTSGNAYLTGFTKSTDFPTTTGAFDTACNQNNSDASDSFVSKLNSTGTALLYSIFLGGRNDDYGYSIAIDKSGNAYVTGYTLSYSDFPITADAYDTTSINIDSYGDAFITGLNASGTALLYSTYMGGGYEDWGTAITVDNSGNVYVTGNTNSSDFPTTPGALDMVLNGNLDGFITKMSLVTISPYLNNYGDFTISTDTSSWRFEKYGDGINAGILSWISTYQCIVISQAPGDKGKLTQVFSVPSTGWYTATARVFSDISDVTKQQKIYLYLQQLDTDSTIAASGNQVVQAGAGGLNVGGWKSLQISFYATDTVLGVQVVAINNSYSGVTGRLYLDGIWVVSGAPQGTTPIPLTNPGFDEGTTGWLIQPYADAGTPGNWRGWDGLLLGAQNENEKGKISQLYSAPTSTIVGSVWVYSGATSINATQKVYLYVYSYDSEYTKVIESGNAILQPGKWIPGQWNQLQFGYTPFTSYNAVQLVAINPSGNPYEAIYFDEVEVKQ